MNKRITLWICSDYRAFLNWYSCIYGNRYFTEREKPFVDNHAGHRNSFFIHLFSSSCRKHFFQTLKAFQCFFYRIYFPFLQSSKSKTSIPTFFTQSLIYCCLSTKISFRVSIKTCWALTIPTINLISFRQTHGTKKRPYLNVNRKRLTFYFSIFFLLPLGPWANAWEVKEQ